MAKCCSATGPLDDEEAAGTYGVRCVADPSSVLSKALVSRCVSFARLSISWLEVGTSGSAHGARGSDRDIASEPRGGVVDAELSVGTRVPLRAARASNKVRRW